MANNRNLWELDSHTKGKHLVLKQYLDAWLPIVGMASHNLVIIDGFSGPGEYKNGDDGSPQIMLKAFQEHYYKELIRGKVTYHFVEKHAGRFDHLKKILETRYSNFPNNLTYELHNDPFDEQLCTHLLQDYDKCETKKSCFIMIDPFGVSDIPMRMINGLMKRPKTEVFISVMYEHLNRFKKQKEFEPHLTALFGTDEWKKSIDIEDSHERKRFLMRLYREQLKLNGASEVIHFDLYRGNKLIYTIFFASTHWKGADKMKSAIWKAIPDGSFKYIGGDGGLLANGYKKNYDPLIEQIQKNFNNQVLTTAEIIKYIGSDKTGFPTDGVKKNVLRRMEEEGNIEPINDKRARKFSYPDDFSFRVLVRNSSELVGPLTQNISLF